eukprot:CAMPEP_0201281916 /NCGR_PEP_ID=MMETSP1317-20130820/4376_1 /ASSEMBLY_ACC=CAM_ASM_000770 /TAXON_ID=187299 /ORGANISM="Undescribed Undescribed, Strain Undescribed" /LENGTH=88 /DNA_ID=CAMNT_0047593153 /DNA_START=332 /DNA_END=598 /DNA_ORIENTATION=+
MCLCSHVVLLPPGNQRRLLLVHADAGQLQHVHRGVGTTATAVPHAQVWRGGGHDQSLHDVSGSVPADPAVLLAGTLDGRRPVRVPGAG